eukprot:snap_masked-scaffold_4-processed-gene-6.34-mRNA-1 protein AED:0.50 eAED:0.50 QI:0/0/0/0.5/1/1/2/0/322
MLCGDDTSALVVDPGTGSVKIGLSGEGAPKIIHQLYDFPKTPITEIIEVSISKTLSTTVTESPIIFSTPDILSIKEKTDLLKNYLSLSPTAVYLAPSSMLSAFSFGKQSAFVCNLGFSSSTFVPVYDGFLLRKSMTSSNLAGKYLNGQILKNYALSNVKRKDFYVEDIKKSFYLVFEDMKYDQSKADEYEGEIYTLPDGEKVDPIKISSERFLAGEKLCEEYPDKILESFKLLDVDLRREMSSNILYCGGTACMPSLPERVIWELGEKQSKMKFKHQKAKDESKYLATWIGASILSSLGTFQQLWISASEVDEYGAENETSN